MSIEEMSKQFANKLYGENMSDDGWLKARYFYERGANAVLEEICACMNGVTANEKYKNVLNKIEELKRGEK